MESLHTIVSIPRPPRIGPPPVLMADEPWCDTCKGRRFTSDGFDEETHHSVIRPCPACSGSHRARIASREQETLIQTVFGGSQIPPDMANWTFATYPLTGDRASWAKVKAFVETALTTPERQRGLYLAGAEGRGKTGLAVSLAHCVIDAQKTCLFFNEVDLFKRLHDTFGGKRHETEQDILSIVTTVSWLILDDVGVVKPTDYVIETYYHILEQRRTKGLFTVFTGNYATSALEKHWRGDSSTAFSPARRVIDRLREYCTGVLVTGRNLRTGGAV